ncbi:MAG TPA: mandelate racemase/muconate lactonizing enzyme family protein [Thermodesulfobacteriota bacterium]|nr:mandelate racemase/muconate lactonizing enzyme family protein [Thermodesulfobacteriota bacterium]
MKISSIELVNVNIPLAPSDLPKPVGRNYGCFMLVRIKTDKGLEGIGDGYYGNSAPGVAATIRETLTPEIMGREATAVGGLYERMYRAGFYSGRIGIYSYAVSAVEMALWDLLGKYHGVPVYELLGGMVSRAVAPYPTLRAVMDEKEEKKVPVYASLQTFRTAEEVGLIAKAAVEEGFKSVKLHQVDIPSVRVTREAVGGGIEVTMDVNGVFNSLEAERFARQLAEFDIGWFEEPIWPPDDYRALAQLRRRSPVPIAGGENESTVYGFERILETEAVDVLQPEILSVGGLLEMYKVLAMAQARSLPVAPHNFKFGPVLAATLNLSLLSSNVFTTETPWFKLEANLFKKGPQIRNGWACLSDLPGLGFEIDEEVVKEYRIEKFPQK